MLLHFERLSQAHVNWARTCSCESILEASCGVLSQTLVKMQQMEPRERQRYKLADNYNAPTQPTLIPRCVKRVYG